MICAAGALNSHATSIGFKWGLCRSLTEVALDDLDLTREQPFAHVLAEHQRVCVVEGDELATKLDICLERVLRREDGRTQ